MADLDGDRRLSAAGDHGGAASEAVTGRPHEHTACTGRSPRWMERQRQSPHDASDLSSPSGRWRLGGPSPRPRPREAPPPSKGRSRRPATAAQRPALAVGPPGGALPRSSHCGSPGRARRARRPARSRRARPPRPRAARPTARIAATRHRRRLRDLPPLAGRERTPHDPASAPGPPGSARCPPYQGLRSCGPSCTHRRGTSPRGGSVCGDIAAAAARRVRRGTPEQGSRAYEAVGVARSEVMVTGSLGLPSPGPLESSLPAFATASSTSSPEVMRPNGV